MEYFYKMTLLLIVCITYNRFSVKKWETVVLDDSLISKALDEVNSVMGKHEGGINYIKHSKDIMAKKGIKGTLKEMTTKKGLKDNLMNAFQVVNGGNHVTEESMKTYLQKLKNEASNKAIDVSKLSKDTMVDSNVLSNLNTNNKLFDFNSIKGKVLEKIQESKSGAVNVATEMLNEKIKELDLDTKMEQLNRIDTVTRKLLPSKYSKMYSLKEIRDTILSELPDDIKTKILLDLEKKKLSGGSYFTDMEKKVASGVSPHSPLSLAKYWFLNIFPFMILLGTLCLIIINGYSEFYENKEEKDSTKKIENILSYLGDNIILSIIIPALLYCVGRFIFDLLKFDGFIIPVLGEIVEVVERIPVLWTCIFGFIVTSFFMKIIISADLGNPECPLDAKTKDKYKERCFPYVWDKKCPEEKSSFSCWFKI